MFRNSHNYRHSRKYSPTLTPYSSTSTIIVTAYKGSVWAVNEISLIAIASNTLQLDGTNTSTKLNITEGQCTCWQNMKYDISNKCVHISDLHTLSGVAQVSTHHCSISSSPGVSTHSTPHIVHADLHSAFIWNVTSCQSQLTICARSCLQ